MNDLIAWLHAQLDEDERIATEAARDWTDIGVAVEAGPDGVPAVAPDNVVAHIARFDPTRMLAEVAAKRAVLDCWHNWRVQYEVRADMRARSLSPTKPVPTHSENLAMAYSDALLMAVGRLAASYADQPGYRDEWKIQ